MILSYARFCVIILFVLLLFENSDARRKTASRKKTQNNSRGSGDNSSGKSSDSDSSSSKSSNSAPSQQNSERKYSSAPYPPSQNTAESKSYGASNKYADVKPSAPVNLSQQRKSTNYQNSPQRPTGWNTRSSQKAPERQKIQKTHVEPANNQKTRINQQPNSGSKIQNSFPQKPAIGWNVPGSKPNSQDNSGYLQSNGGWNSGYKTSGTKRVETPVKKETSKLQQSSPNQPQPPQPGWNVPGQNKAPVANPGGWNSGYGAQGAPPAYPHHNAAPPSYNGQSSWGAPPAYPGHAPSGYGGFGHGHPQTGGYGGGYGGYGGNSGYGGHGGYGGYGGSPQQSFGGYNSGYGAMGMGGGGYGHGGYGSGGFGGGFGSPAGFGGGYPMKKKSFFSASTIGSVVAGMLVYNMASSLISHGLGTKKPYTVVNYYNQDPDKKVEEIKLPSNILTLCEGNATQICGQGMQSICTQNGTVLCVATMNQALPCDQGGNSALCVSTTVPCADANDPICQNSTKKDKLEVDVSVPCFTNVTLDVNIIDQSQTQPNTKYTYCVTTMAVAGPEYSICDDFSDTNDYRSVLNGNTKWFLEIDGLRRNYSMYNYERPMETNGEINMPVTVLVKCSENVKVCPPGTIATCTSFNEIMCLASNVDAKECPEKNTTCVKSEIPCAEGSTDSFCQNKTEGSTTVTLDMPCFANITINAPIPKFNLAEYNGTLPELTTASSYTYHFNYCVITLGLPGSDFDLCITKEGKEKQDKEQQKS